MAPPRSITERDRQKRSQNNFTERHWTAQSWLCCWCAGSHAWHCRHERRAHIDIQTAEFMHRLDKLCRKRNQLQPDRYPFSGCLHWRPAGRCERHRGGSLKVTAEKCERQGSGKSIRHRDSWITFREDNHGPVWRTDRLRGSRTFKPIDNFPNFCQECTNRNLDVKENVG